MLPLLCTVRLRRSRYWPRGFACDCCGFQARRAALPRIVRPWPPLLTSAVIRCRGDVLLRCLARPRAAQVHPRPAGNAACISECVALCSAAEFLRPAAVWRAGVNVISHVMVRFCSAPLVVVSRLRPMLCVVSAGLSYQVFVRVLHCAVAFSSELASGFGV